MTSPETLAYLRNMAEGKMTWLFAVVIGSPMGALLAQIPEHPTLTTIVLSCFGGGSIAAVLSQIPKIMAARTHSRTGEIANMQHVLQASQELHLQEIKRITAQAAIRQRERALLIASKHVLQSEIQRLIWHVQVLMEQIREKGGVPPDFAFRSYSELLGNEDREMLKLTEIELRIDE